ncbi:MAG TPA: transglutaminase domain-containing protein [Armatimonadota bacterium]|jgi:transglutaminase-like putative cysteine protease
MDLRRTSALENARALNTRNNDRSLRKILPLYFAAYAVLLCALGAFAATTADERFGTRGTLLVIVGGLVSIACRLKRLSQNTAFGVLAAVLVVLVFWVSAGSAAPVSDLLTLIGSEHNSGPGTMLAWFVVVYSFAMITDEVIVFSIVPCLALLGLMASENPNAEIVVYFLGMVLCSVFVLVYDNVLSKAPEAKSDSTPGLPADAGIALPGAHDLRSPLALTVAVLGLALALGFVASLPIRMAGAVLSERAPQLNIPAAAEFSAEVSSRYINQLDLTGAPPRLSDRVVMQIASARPMYWRAKVFDDYAGYAWTVDPETRPLRSMSYNEWRVTGIHRDPATGELGARVPLRQIVRLLDPPIGGALVAAAEPVAVSSPVPVHQDRERCLRASDGRSLTSYGVLSMVSVATPEQLRRAGDTYPLGLRETNTLLPDGGNETLSSIAHEVTRGMTNRYDQVKALETYLRNDFEYSLTPPRTPPDEDSVTFFLTHSKVGYCQAFASAMAVLCRELNIPARLATGFAPGVPSADQSVDGDRVWTLRERDLHAWTEVYFPGYGWITFDPTSSRTAHASWGEMAREYLRNLLAGATARTTGPLVIVMLIAGLGGYMVKSFAWDPVRSSTWWKTRRSGLRPKRYTPEERWDAVYVRASQPVQRRAGARLPYQTPYEYAAQVKPRLSSDAASALDRLTRLYVQGAFRRGELSDEDFHSLQQSGAALKQAINDSARA